MTESLTGQVQPARGTDPRVAAARNLLILTVEFPSVARRRSLVDALTRYRRALRALLDLIEEQER